MVIVGTGNTASPVDVDPDGLVRTVKIVSIIFSHEVSLVEEYCDKWEIFG